MSKQEFTLKQEFTITKREVKELASKLLPEILKTELLCLSGNLGSGKTFFAGEVIKLLTKNNELTITSPTFNIVNVYNILGEKSIYHFDLYRLKAEDELENIGFFEALESGICIIEWYEIAKKFLKNAKFVDIINQGTEKRKFIVYG